MVVQAGVRRWRGRSRTAAGVWIGGRGILFRHVAAALLVAVMFVGLAATNAADAETKQAHSLEGGVSVEISYPDGLVAGREGTVSILVRNGGWEDKQDISFSISLSDDRALAADPPSPIEIGSLAEGGSYGESLVLRASTDAGPGTHYLNLRYAHVLVANNETPQDPFFYDIAIPVEIREDARVGISTQAPESIFSNAEFPIVVGVVSEDIDIRDVRLRVVPPAGIEFRGETAHTFSKIEKGMPVEVMARIVTPAEDIITEHRLPFEIIVEYVDDVGEEKTDAQTISVLLRPRTFMELTTDGGIWVGNFFIAPYISLGTVIGIPAGAIFSLLLKRRFGDRRRDKAEKTGGG